MQFADLPTEFEKIMATCHGLTTVGGSIIGDPLELKMFDSVGWTLVE
jgi:cation-transporting ATPase 13A3/4/5